MSQEIKICSSDSGCFLGGLSATDTICSGNQVISNCFVKVDGTSSQFLKADGSVDSTGYTTCTGDVTGIDAGTAITVADGATATPTVGVTTSCNSAWNAKTTCTGTTTPSNTQTFTNKSGNISQWTNDSGYTTCAGDVTGIDAGTAITVSDGATSTPSVAVTSACNTAWNSAKSLADGLTTCAGLACVGDITGVTAGNGLSGGGTSSTVTLALDGAALTALNQSACAGINCTGTTTASNTQTFTNKAGNISQWTNDSGYTTCTGTLVAGDIAGLTCCTGTTTPSNTQTFTNKSGSNSQWTNDAGYTTCTGDITNVGVGTGLDGGGASGSVTISLDLSELTDMTGAIDPGVDELILLDNGAERRKIFSEIFGSNAYNSTTIATNNNQLTNGCGYTTCTGTTTPSNTQTFTNKSGNISQWTNDSGYTTCAGDVTGIDAGTAITISDGTTSTPSVAVTSACNTAWNSAKSLADGLTTCAGLACVGDITGVTTGPYLTGGATSGSAEVGIDSACAAKWDTAAAGDISEVVAGTNLTGGGSSGCVTINMDTGGAGAATYGNTGNSCKIDTITLDAYGRVTAVACGPTGDITGVTAGNGLSGGGSSGGVTLALDGDALTALNQSACAGLNCTGTTTASNSQTFTNKAGNISQWTNDSGYTTCTGTTTPSNSQTFTNKSGNISQWTNDSGYTTCNGDITGVTAGNGLSGGGTSGTATLALDGDALTALNQSACAGLNCVGDITNVSVGTGLAGGGGSGSVTLCVNSTCNSTWNAKTTCTGTTTPSNTQTFTNKSGNISQWTNDSGYTTCNGDITGVTAGTLLDGGGSSGSVTLNVDLSELTDGTGAIVPSTDEIVYLDAGSQKRKLFSEIFGSNAYNSTTIATNNNQLTNGCGYTTCTGTLVAGDIAGLTCCTGTTTPSNTQTFTNKSGNISQWTNDSGYTTCNGDITGVTAGTLLDGGGASGSVTLNVDLSELTDGTAAIVPSTDEIVYLDAGSQKRKLFSEIFGSNAYTSTTIPTNNNQLTNGCGYTSCTGDITAVTAGDGITGGATSGSASVAVDSTVARTNVAETFTNDVTVQGNLCVQGDLTCIDTVIETTSAIEVNNNGTGPALCVNQCGVNDIVNFLDDGTSSFYIENGGNVGINDTNPNERLDVNGNINVTGSYKMDDGDVINTGKCFVGAQVRPTTDIADAYIASAATWNAKTTCTGTTTPSNTQTFTNKSGSNSQWTNDAGYTTCTGTTTPSNTQTFTNKSGNISQWTNNSGYTTCTGDITGVTAGNGLSGGATSGTATLALDGDALTALNQSGCAGLNCVGTVTGVAGTSGITSTGGTSPTLCITSTCQTKFDQSTCAGINCIGTLVASDLDDLNALISCPGLDCTGTTTASNTQTFTNKSGNISQWTNNSGYTTCTGDITGVTAGTLLDGGGASGSVTLNVDLSELTDGTAAIVPTSDEIVYLDAGSQKRKLFSEIFGSNAYNSTTIPTNNTQLTNGCGFTTCTGTVVAGDISSFTSCTGTTTPSNTQTFTNKSGNISQWTNDSGYTTCTGTVVAGDISSFTSCTGTLRPAGTIATNDYAKYDASGCLTGRSCSEVRSDLGIGSAASCTAASLDQSGCAGLLCTGTTTASNSQTFTNKGGSNSQWTNDAGYTTCTGTTTPSNTQTFTNKSGNISQWTNNSGYTTCTGDITGVTAGAGLSGGATSGTATVALDGAMVATLNQSGCAGLLCTGTTTASNTQTFTNKSGSNSQWTNDAGYTGCTGTTTPSNTQTFTNKSGNISQWTNDSGYLTSEVGTVYNVQGDGSTIQVTNGSTDACVGICSACITKWDSGGTTYTAGNGISLVSDIISTCFYGDFSQKILTNCASVCLGKCAGKSIVEGSGVGNVAIGGCAACTTSTGDANLAIGKQALQQNSTGSRNVAIGDVAGFQITGSDNLVFGRSAGCGITSAGCNVVIGNYAHRTSTNNGTGASNVAIGTQSLRDNVSGACNVAIGFCAAQELSTGCKNIALGPCALGATTGIVTGHCNIAIGEATAWKNTSGSNNIAMGFVALGCNCTGSCNVAIGYTAGRFTGTGTTQMQAPTRSIFIGCDSTGGGGSSTNNETVIGSGAVGCGSNTVMLGNSSVTVVCSNGTFSTVSDLRDKTCICDLELGLDFIGDLKPKTFNMITDRDDPEGSISCKRHGFIAQDVLALEGDDNVIISKTNPERLGYTGEHIIPILVKGMQEQQAIIDDLKTRLEVLEG